MKTMLLRGAAAAAILAFTGAAAQALVIDQFDIPVNTIADPNDGFTYAGGQVIEIFGRNTTGPSLPEKTLMRILETNAGTTVLTSTGGTAPLPFSGNSTFNGGPGIVGGTRILSTTLTNVLPGPGTSTSVGSIIGQITNGGLFEHSQSNAIAGFSQVVWGGDDADDNGVLDNGVGARLGGVDLTDGGLSTHFLLGVNSADLGIQWELYLEDTDGSVAFHRFSTTALIVALTEFSVALSIFNSGVDVAGLTDSNAALDLTSIDLIRFSANYFDTKAQVDTSIDYLRTGQIPEPAALALFGLSLLSLGLAARRRA